MRNSDFAADVILYPNCALDGVINMRPVVLATLVSVELRRKQLQQLRGSHKGLVATQRLQNQLPYFLSDAVTLVDLPVPLHLLRQHTGGRRTIGPIHRRIELLPRVRDLFRRQKVGNCNQPGRTKQKFEIAERGIRVGAA